MSASIAADGRKRRRGGDGSRTPPAGGRRWRWLPLGAAAAAAALGLWAIDGGFSVPGRRAADGGSAGPEEQPTPAAVADLVVEVLAVYPHDPGAFTQGLVWAGETLYESTGQYGASSLREVDLASGEVRRRVDLPRELFAEGLALLPPEREGGAGRLLQLTWREGLAISYDAASLQRLGVFRYEGEGWGLCFDGRRLVMSDGGAELTVRDRDDFTITERLPVRLHGRPVLGLNELECVGGSVYANVYTTPMIVRIDAASGRVTATVDASGLLTADEARGTEVLNGIAYNPAGDAFYLTGKYWPKLFAVRFVPRGRG